MAQPMQAGINERDGKGGVARPGELAMSRRARTWTVWTAVKPDMGLRMPGTRARTHAILILFIA